MTLVVAVALVAVACGKSGTSADGAAAPLAVVVRAPRGRGGIGGAAGSAAGTGGAVAGHERSGWRRGRSGGAAGGAGGTSGSAGAAGTTSADGGVDAALACTTGETRCDSSGRRLRCTSDGSWADDNYVCTVALSGSSDYNTMCALKADGRLACWASGDWANGQAAMMVTRAPADTWKQISVADDAFAICAIGTSGTISCWRPDRHLQWAPARGNVRGALVQHLRKLRPHRHRHARLFQRILPLPTDFVGQFKQIVTANYFVYGIDENDALHAPDFMLSSYPAGKYKQIIANNGASCALRDDGAIFCYPVAGTLPPPTGNAACRHRRATASSRLRRSTVTTAACAIQADRTVTCWLGAVRRCSRSRRRPAERSPTSRAATGAMCGIRTDGTTVCWEVPGFDPMVPPAGW